jgi:hypothetical protein
MIEDLDNQIEDLRDKIEKKKEIQNEQILNLRAKTDDLADNDLLIALVKTERLKGLAEFHKKILSLIDNPEQKEDIKKKSNSLDKAASEAENALNTEEKKADEKNKDNEEYQKAKEETIEEVPTKEPTKSPENTESPSDEPSDEPSKPTETSAIAQSEDPEEKKKAELDYKLKVLRDKLESTKEAAEKAESSEDKSNLDSITDNIKKIESAIDDLEKEKSSLGESFQKFEGEIWAIEWMIESLIDQIQNGYYDLND